MWWVNGSKDDFSYIYSKIGVTHVLKMKQLDVYVSPAVTQKFEMNGNGNLILSPPLIQYIVVL